MAYATRKPNTKVVQSALSAQMKAKRRKHDWSRFFSAIVTYKKSHDGNSPSLVDLMYVCGISSTSVARSLLIELEQKGLIELLGGKYKSRSIHVVGGQWQYSTIPFDFDADTTDAERAEVE